MFGFALAAARLKGVRRAGWVEKLGMESPESVADHSYATAMLVMARSDEEGLDTALALRMALLHDLAESETGDRVRALRVQGSGARARGRQAGHGGTGLRVRAPGPGRGAVPGVGALGRARSRPARDISRGRACRTWTIASWQRPGRRS